MTRYRTLGGMLSAAFAERGMCDDKGNLIQPIEEPISDKEYKRELEKKIRGTVSRVRERQSGECYSAEITLGEKV